jgi:hypothetical protein
MNIYNFHMPNIMPNATVSMSFIPNYGILHGTIISNDTCRNMDSCRHFHPWSVPRQPPPPPRAQPKRKKRKEKKKWKEEVQNRIVPVAHVTSNGGGNVFAAWYHSTFASCLLTFFFAIGIFIYKVFGEQ